MSTLHDIQAAFYDAILIGGTAEESLLTDLAGAAKTTRHGLAAYRRSILGNLHSSLLVTYPVIASIVGPEFFHETARQYILSHPSLSGDLNEYGEHFADFLAAYPHASSLEYLPDVARLEWLVQTVFYAPDSNAADFSIFARIPPERYCELCFTLAPGFARVDSVWPLPEIWRVNQPDFEGDMSIDFSHGAHVLVLRRNGLVQVEALSPGGAALFDTLAAGLKLETATAKATETDPDFDLPAALQQLMQDGLLIGAELNTDNHHN